MKTSTLWRSELLLQEHKYAGFAADDYVEFAVFVQVAGSDFGADAAGLAG
jgi:hypothetical protein